MRDRGSADLRPGLDRAVLQADTAVLVDEYGVPRVRCQCGNPLTALRPVESAPQYRGEAWPGFSPAALTAVTPSPRKMIQFGLLDVETGESCGRPAGTDGE